MAQPEGGALEPERIDAAALEQAELGRQLLAGDLEHRVRLTEGEQRRQEIGVIGMAVMRRGGEPVEHLASVERMDTEHREDMPGAEPALGEHAAHDVGGIVRMIAERRLLRVQRRNGIERRLPGGVGLGDQPVDRFDERRVGWRANGAVVIGGLQQFAGREAQPRGYQMGAPICTVRFARPQWTACR